MEDGGSPRNDATGVRRGPGKILAVKARRAGGEVRWAGKPPVRSEGGVGGFRESAVCSEVLVMLKLREQVLGNSRYSFSCKCVLQQWVEHLCDRHGRERGCAPARRINTMLPQLNMKNAVLGSTFFTSESVSRGAFWEKSEIIEVPNLNVTVVCTALPV